MTNTFCPFINDECQSQCRFYDYGKCSCVIFDACESIEKISNCDFKQIQSDIDSICSNTGSDQTDSYRILMVLQEIKTHLDNHS